MRMCTQAENVYIFGLLSVFRAHAKHDVYMSARLLDNRLISEAADVYILLVCT